MRRERSPVYAPARRGGRETVVYVTRDERGRQATRSSRTEGIRTRACAGPGVDGTRWSLRLVPREEPPNRLGLALASDSMVASPDLKLLVMSARSMPAMSERSMLQWSPDRGGCTGRSPLSPSSRTTTRTATLSFVRQAMTKPGESLVSLPCVARSAFARSLDAVAFRPHVLHGSFPPPDALCFHRAAEGCALDRLARQPDVEDSHSLRFGFGSGTALRPAHRHDHARRFPFRVSAKRGRTGPTHSPGVASGLVVDRADPPPP